MHFFPHVLSETLNCNCGSMILYEFLSLSLGLGYISFINLVETATAFISQELGLKSASKHNHEA